MYINIKIKEESLTKLLGGRYTPSMQEIIFMLNDPNTMKVHFKSDLNNIQEILYYNRVH